MPTNIPTAGGIGHLTGAHGNHGFDVDVYSDGGNEQWCNGVFNALAVVPVATGVRHPTGAPVGAGPPAAARRSNETSEPTSPPSKAST